VEKIKVAFIFKESNIFLSGKHFDNVFFNFFMKALTRNDEIDVKYIHGESELDVSKFDDMYNAMILFDNHNWGIPDKLIGISNLKIPIICRIGDSQNAEQVGKIKNHEKLNVDYYFSFEPEFYFHKFYPKDFRYRNILFGVEPSLFQNLIEFDQRTKNRILVSGAIGNDKFSAKLFNKLNRRKWSALQCYRLRTKCTTLPYVDYTATLSHEYVNDKYPLLLQKYAASVAATTYMANTKYWENAAAGCLTFMEITRLNRGKSLGFVDNKSAIFINEDNYKEKFSEYLQDKNNPKWKEIAMNGREIAMEKFNNDRGVEELINLIKELV
tara:strand:- start:339 stop:1316 length:978 start_codon:yes stop_codon:yes gene_type:complete